MQLDVVTIGNELLLGFTVDSNGAEIAQMLSDIGVTVSRRITVPDDGDAIAEAVQDGLRRTGLVICTGGLGPTRDDITKKTVADLFDAPLRVDEAYLEELRIRFAKWRGNQPMPESNRTQAEIPEGATVLPNMRGTAPGLWLSGDAGEVIMLPGVPREMRGLMRNEVIPRLTSRAESAGVIRSITLRTTGISESGLADRLNDADEHLGSVTLAYLPSLEGVDLRLTAWHQSPEDAERGLTEASRWLRDTIPEVLYEGDLAAVVLDALRDKGWTLSVAESCTGGMIGARLTAVPGSSDVFAGGAITYSNETKATQIGVDPNLIATHGAVSEEVAVAMAGGVAQALSTDVAIAVTGIAGPGGGTDDKPVGTVCLAVSGPGMGKSLCMVIPGSRNEIRARTAQTALNLLRLQLRSGG